jgi:hypothetical protein
MILGPLYRLIFKHMPPTLSAERMMSMSMEQKSTDGPAQAGPEEGRNKFGMDIWFAFTAQNLHLSRIGVAPACGRAT